MGELGKHLHKSPNTYSYIVKSNVAQTTWDRTLRDTVHPAGMEVFGDLIIRSEILFNPEFIVETTGTIFYKFIATDLVSTSETIAKVFAVAYTDAPTATESHGIDFTMGTLTNQVSGQDQGSSPYCVTGYWNDGTDGNEKFEFGAFYTVPSGDDIANVKYDDHCCC